MADEAADETGMEEAPEAAPATKGGKRKRLMLILAAVLLVGGGGAGAGWYFLAPHGEEAEAAPPPPTAEELVDVPAMSVNLRTGDGATRMLRVHLMLVPGEQDKAAIEASLPLVIDSYQPFLRELRPEDISGSAATFRLKEEMLVRANGVLGAGAVRDVLIQELVQQ